MLRKLKQKPIITILSSFAKDVIVNDEGRILKTQNGGPAFFIKNVFEAEKVPHRLICGRKIEVEILLNNKGEARRLKKSPVCGKPGKVVTKNALLSTIANEWPFELRDYSGRIFIDVQGFVRDWRSFGKKKKILIFKNYAPFCVKATSEELKYLPRRFIHDQKKRCLIITRGKKGSEIFYKNRAFHFHPRAVINSPHTIGAGDTFFASFVCEFIRTTDIKQSGIYATENVLKFLRVLKKLTYHIFI